MAPAGANVAPNMPVVDNEIRGRLALVTGANGGIGNAIAESLYHAGAHLALAYNRDSGAIIMLAERLLSSPPKTSGSPDASASTSTTEAQAQQLPGSAAQQHPATRQRISFHQADLTQPAAITKLLAEIRQDHGRGVDILVSNAGIGKRIEQIWDISLDEFDRTMNVNLRAAFLLVKGTVDHMKAQRWGRVIFVSSIAAYGAGLNGCHYAASKGALTGMMKNLASRLAAFNISVNDVAPAMIESTGMIPSGDMVPGLRESIPLQRLGTPDEVAKVVLMFAGTGYCTGQSIVIGGGLRYHN